MLTLTEVYDAAHTFNTAITDCLTIRGIRWDRNSNAGEDPGRSPLVPGVFHAQTVIGSVSIWNCQILTSDEKSYFPEVTRKWRAQVHEARARTAGEKPDSLHVEQLNHFDRKNPHARVKIQSRVVRVMQDSPLNVSGFNELKVMVTASAPYRRRGHPIEFRRADAVVMEDMIELDMELMGRLGLRLSHIFAPEHYPREKLGDYDDIPF